MGFSLLHGPYAKGFNHVLAFQHDFILAFEYKCIDSAGQMELADVDRPVWTIGNSGLICYIPSKP